MKTLQTFVLCGMLSSGLLSCLKEKEKEHFDPVNSIYETYTGKQGEGVEEPGDFLQLKLEDHGSLLSLSSNKALPGSGSWEISGNRFTASFRQKADYKIIMLEGVYDEKENKISGTWGYDSFTTGGGSFFIEKESTKIAHTKKKKDFAVGVLLDRFF